MLGKLTKRMELVTGLEIPIHHAHDPYITAASQAWQMGVYGPGGHFWPHYDGFEKVGPVSVDIVYSNNRSLIDFICRMPAKQLCSFTSQMCLMA